MRLFLQPLFCCAILSSIDINIIVKEVFDVKTGIFYHKRTGSPVQIIARAQTKPTYQEVICYQELTEPYDHYVMEKRQFFAEYVRDFEELPLKGQRQIAKRDDLPDKMPRISKGEITDPDSQDEEEKNNQPADMFPKDGQAIRQASVQKMLDFFDADAYEQKIKIFEEFMDTDPEQVMIDNIAVSMDLALEDGVDIVERIRSELRIRCKYEGERGDRL